LGATFITNCRKTVRLGSQTQNQVGEVISVIFHSELTKNNFNMSEG